MVQTNKMSGISNVLLSAHLVFGIGRVDITGIMKLFVGISNALFGILNASVGTLNAPFWYLKRWYFEPLPIFQVPSTCSYTHAHTLPTPTPSFNLNVFFLQCRGRLPRTGCPVLNNAKYCPHPASLLRATNTKHEIKYKYCFQH